MTMKYDADSVKIAFGDVKCEGFAVESTISKEFSSWFELEDLSEYDANHPDYSETVVHVNGFCSDTKIPYSFGLVKGSVWHKYLLENPDEIISLGMVDKEVETM